MVENPTIAVIMTAYNEEENWIRQSIESILGQSYRNIHFYILLDNPENERLKHIISGYADSDKRIRFLMNDKNLGLVASLNKLLGIVQEDYVARMDADDISTTDRLEQEFAFLEENELDFVMSSTDMIYDDRMEPGPKIPTLLTADMREAEKYGNVATHPTWLLKKSVYDLLNGYRNVRHCEDLDFVLRALQKDVKIGRMEQTLLHYRMRESGISKSYAYEQFFKSDAIRKAYEKGKLLDEIDPVTLNEKYGNAADEQKKAFDVQKQKLDLFSAKLYQGKYMFCMMLALKGIISSRIYRKMFFYTFRNKIKMDRIYAKAGK